MEKHWPNWKAEVLRALDKGNLLLARDDEGISAFCAFEVNRAGFLGPVAARPDLIGRGAGAPALVGALHELRARGRSSIEVTWVGPIVPYAAARRPGQQRLLRLPQGLVVNLLPQPRFVDLQDRLTANTTVTERVDASLPPQGYTLTIGDTGVALVGGDDAGCFYGRATLAQLARLHDGGLPIGTIRDHPDLAIRGVMLDVSRDKVPTTETLYALIDRLASWKVNQVQLYSEHTFAYRNHPEVHADASPFTPDEIRALDAFCRERFVELVPNQNCLGHMNRWLKHPRYHDARARHPTASSIRTDSVTKR